MKQVRSYSSKQCFQEEFAKFSKLSLNSVLNYHNCKGVKFLTRLRLGLCHLHLHKFKHFVCVALMALMLKQIRTFLFTVLCSEIKDASSWTQLMILILLIGTTSLNNWNCLSYLFLYAIFIYKKRYRALSIHTMQMITYFV